VHFQRGWSELISRLEKRFTDGPINWSAQKMMYQEPKRRNSSSCHQSISPPS
jgi:hypothetical protein